MAWGLETPRHPPAIGEWVWGGGRTDGAGRDGGLGCCGAGRGDPWVPFPYSCVVHPEPRVTAGAGGPASTHPRCGVAVTPCVAADGRCWCDLSAVKETPVCVPSTQQVSPQLSRHLGHLSLEQGGLWGCPPGACQGGAGRVGGASPTHRQWGRQGAGSQAKGRGHGRVGGNEGQGWEWEAAAPLRGVGWGSLLVPRATRGVGEGD